MKLTAVPSDLISTKEAAQLLGYVYGETIRYYIRKGVLKGFKNYRGYTFVSRAEALEKLSKDEFKPL